MNEDRGYNESGDPMSLHVASRTHVGLRRQSNQDFLAVRSLAGERTLLVVADGMGGHNGGERASRLAVETFLAILEGSQDRIEERLRDALARANDAVVREANAESDLQGMGTTFVAAALWGERGRIINLGDSRACLLRDGQLLRITQDHSLVGDLVRRGEISEAEAEVHPRRNVLTRAVGIEGEFRPDEFDLELREGETLLLCSDGLHGMINDRQIESILTNRGSLEAHCDALIEAALDAGGKDNVTVILARRGGTETYGPSGPATDPGYEDEGGARKEWERPNVPNREVAGEEESGGEERKNGKGWLYLLILVLIGLAIWGAVAFDLFTPKPEPVDFPDSLGVDTNGLILDSNTQLTPSDMVNDSVWSDSLSSPGAGNPYGDTVMQGR